MVDPDEPSWDLLRKSIGRKSPRTAELGAWAIGIIEDYLGTSWMPVAWRRRELPDLFWMSLVLRQAYLELVELALLIEDNVQTDGRARVRNACRTDVSRGRLLHARLQLETASLAKMHGCRVALEANQPSRYPADVVIGDSHRDLLVECQVVRPPEQDIAAGEVFEWASMTLARLQSEHRVDISGEIQTDQPELLRTDLEDLDVILHVSSRSGPAEIQGWASRLTVNWHGRVEGSSIRAVRAPTNLGRHLAGKLRSKFGQLGEEASVWLRIDARNGVWQHTHLIAAPLSLKLQQLGDYAAGLCAGVPGVAGVVMSSGSCTMHGEVLEEAIAGEGGRWALRMELPGGRARETVIVPLVEGARAEALRWRQIYETESVWLPTALARRDLPSLETLFGTG